MSSGNLLLDALPGDEADSLIEETRRVTLEPGAIIVDQGEPMEFVLFPVRGAISLQSVLETGQCLDAAIVGAEGVVGLPSAHGSHTSDWRCVVQVPGHALSLEAATFLDRLRRPGELALATLRYSEQLVALASQTAVCGRFHSTRQRAARWILLLHDRSDGDEFPITHEILSSMVGASRPSVSVAANDLRRAGAIDYRRGRIVVRDRATLEELSCECYGRIDLTT